MTDTRFRILIEPEREVIAHCALKHEWPTTYRVERDKFVTKSQGRRPTFKFHHIYGQDHCPVCGHRQMGCRPK